VPVEGVFDDQARFAVGAAFAAHGLVLGVLEAGHVLAGWFACAAPHVIWKK
jgi:hypothetical protein